MMMANVKPIFGQEYRHSYAYDEEKFLLLSGSSTVTSHSIHITRNLETSAAIMSDHDDFKNLVKALQITEMQLLEMQMRGVKSIKKIIEFIEKNVRGKTMVLNINVVTHESKILSSKDKIYEHLKKVSKFLLGHNVLVCVPVDDTADNYNLANIKNFTTVPPNVLQLFQREAPALINYKREESRSVTEIMQESQHFSSDEIISLYAKYHEAECIKSYLPAALIVAGIGVIGYLLYKKFYQSK